MKKLLLSGLSAVFFVLLGNISVVGQTVTINGTPGSTSPNIVMGTQNYHASENLYFNAEFASFPFTSVPISRIGFYVNNVGSPTSFSNVKIYLRNVDASVTTLSSGTYSTLGYTEVFSGTINLNLPGLRYVNLTSPFNRIAGNNLMMLIERTDNLTHPNFVFISAQTPADAPANTSRRYNDVAELSPATFLTASSFRAAVQFAAPLAAIDARVDGISSIAPPISCFDAPRVFQVLLRNAGTTNIAPGAASISFRLGGANRAVLSSNNTTLILPGETELVPISNVPVSGAGVTLDTAIVTLPSDGAASNDTAFSAFLTATNLSVNNVSSLFEGAETDLPVVSYSQPISGSRSLWRLYEGPTPYSNDDLPGLSANGGINFYLFDSWSGSNSSGFTDRLYSNCITLAGTLGTCNSTLSFYMSHDDSYPNDFDSLYVTISTNKGLTWTRLVPGFQRYDASFSTPGWRQETVNLSAYNGQTIQIGFEGVSKYGNVIGLDDIAISSGCTLPVTTLDFVGFRSNGVHLLKWSTSTEVNNAGFELQRSGNGTEFTSMASIASQAQDGNSNRLLQYSYTDAKPLDGINYYRIKQTDLDGKVHFSKTILIEGGKITSFTMTRIAPNPARDKVYASVEAPKAGTITFSVTDAAGKVLVQQNAAVNAGENIVPINTSGLRGGAYFIKAVCADGCDAGVKRFIKE